MKMIPKNEKGYTLVLILMVFVVFSVLTTAIIGLSVNNSTIARGERNDQSVFYIAEAGINHSLAVINQIAKEEAKLSKDNTEFISKVSNRISSTNFNDLDFEEVFGGNPEVKVEVHYLDEHKYQIDSKGKIGQKARKLSQTIQITFEPESIDGGNVDTSTPSINIPDRMAVFVNGDIEIPNGTIIGNIGTNMEGEGSISFDGGGKVNGSIFVPKGSEEMAIDKPDWMNDVSKPKGMESKGLMELPPFPDYPSYTYPDNQTIKKGYNQKKVIENGGLYIDDYISNGYELKLNENLSLTTIKLTSDYKLKINVGDSDKVIVVDDLDITNGHIEIVGTGKLTFLVRNKIVVGSSSTVNNGGNIEQVSVFLKGSDDPNKPKNIVISGGQKIVGSLYAEDANISLTSGGSIAGNIFTGGKKVEINGGTSANPSLILAPNAAVEVSGGGTVKGSIYADSFKISGGASVTYGKINDNYNPTFPGTKPPIEGTGYGGETNIKLEEFKEL